jgi:effector-binding domain-containing protein
LSAFFYSFEPPLADHSVIFKNPKTKTLCLVYHTYHDSEYVAEKVIPWAAGQGLKVFISPKSWYSQHCTMVVICLQDREVTFINKMEEEA